MNFKNCRDKQSENRTSVKALVFKYIRNGKERISCEDVDFKMAKATIISQTPKNHNKCYFFCEDQLS